MTEHRFAGNVGTKRNCPKKLPMNGLTMTASSLCQDGMWVTEPHAIELLKLEGASSLKEKLNSNALPHVHVEQANKPNVPPPFSKHVFYYVGPLGTAVSRLSMSLQFLQWVELCRALDSTEASKLDPKVLTLFSKYSGNGINMQTLGSEVADMKRIKAVLPISSLVEEGEIYIRADGKKVRRVTRTVTRSQSTSSDEDNATSSFAEGEIYTRADGKRVRRVKRPVSNSPGDVPSLSGNTPNSSVSQDEGEIFTRPDGTKVRRIRKTIARSNSNELEKTSSSGLTSFIGRSAGGPGKKKSGAATVTGATNSKSFAEGEIYVNKDGKRVRRVKKASVTPSAAGDLGSSGLDGFVGNGPKTSKKWGSTTVIGSTPSKSFTEGEIYTRADGKRVRRVKRAPDPSTVAGGNVGTSDKSPTTPVTKDEGEIFTRPDGTKVRRIRKTIARSNSNELEKTSSTGLNSFIGGSAGGPGKKKSGAATVTGATNSKSFAEGEVYINKDGKKVRRVKKVPVTPTAASDAPALEGFLDTSIKKKKKKGSGSASVGGDASAGLNGFLDTSIKKKKKKGSGSASVGGDASDGLQGFLDTSIKKKKKKDAGSASVGGDASSGLEGFLDTSVKRKKKKGSGSASVGGDASAGLGGYVGKKWGKRGSSASLSGDTPEKSFAKGDIYLRADGKMVRRIKKDTGDTATTNGSKEKSLDSLLASGTSSSPKRSGSATVSGDIISNKADEYEIIVRDGKKFRRRKLPAAPTNDSEIYRRADGKLVRRMKKEAPSPKAAGDLAGFLDTKAAGGQKSKSGSATVVGDAVAPSFSELLRSKNDGLTSKDTTTAPQTAPMSEASSHQKEKENQPEDPVSATAEEADGADFVDAKKLRSTYESATASNVNTSSAPVAPAAAPSVEPTTKSPAPTTSAAPPLSDDDQAVADFYLKKRKMGMPDVAIHHKMEQDEVDTHIIVFVMGDQASAAAPSSESTPISQVAAPTVGAAPPLSDDDQAMANFYLKKKKMGMPDVAIRHKMEQDEVDARVIAFVMGDQAPAAAPSTESMPNSQAPAPVSTAGAAPPLSDDDQAMANFYLKKKKMGMPDVAIRHKMEQDEVDAHVIAFVMGDQPPAIAPSAHQDANKAISTSPGSATPAPTTQTESSAPIPPRPSGPIPVTPSSQQPPATVAYKVVVGDPKEPEPKSLAAALQASKPLKIDSDAMSVGTVALDEKFAVKVNDDKTKSETEPGESGQPEAKTKFLTLDELAKMSGQSRESLEQLVTEKRTRGQSPPRFSLQPLEPQEQLYECAIPQAHPKSFGTPARAPSGSDQKNMSEVKDGHEIVNSDLANTARAVSALGDGDMASLLAKLQSGDVEELLTKLREAEKRQKKLEKQLAQSGIAIAEDIDYAECQEKVLTIAKRMGEIGGSDVTNPDKAIQNKLREEYFKLEQGMERYNTALMLTEEYQAEQLRIEKKWEDDNAPENLEALKKLRRHMPVNIKNMSEAELTNQPTPNGKFLPNAIAKKFKRTNVLQCLRLNPADLERMHPSTLENMRVTGLTLTERRAIYAHLKVLGPKWEKNKAEKMTERKWTWYKMMKNNFKESLAPYQRHVTQYGPPGNHPYATRDKPDVGCPMIGKQCPIKADKLPDYDNADYGYTDKEEYEISNVKKADIDDPGAKAMAEALELVKEKKANERGETLKSHYKGKLLQVSKANGSCEAMDDAMDKLEYYTLKWIEFDLEHPDEKEDDKKKEISLFMDATNELKLAVLDFAQRSGMQMSGRKKEGGDADDIRSSVECRLSEDLFECAQEYFTYIKNRAKEIGIKDTRLEKTIELLDSMLTELHEKNIATLEKLGVKRGDRSRKMKKNIDIRKEAEEKMAVPKEGEGEADAPTQPSGGGRGGGGRGGLLDGIAGRGGRGGLLDGIAGRGGGRGGLLDGIAGRGKRGGGGGRGGLLDGIAARGRGGGGGGRGGLLDGIAARGRGGGGGGRGGLLDGIAARGRGGGGGRGGLLDGIAARGRGRGGGAGGGDAGGRGGLMAAIAAKAGGG
jgi:hypothetical protein